MAIKEVRREWDECQLDYTKEFILHTEADVAKLPKCCIGSTAIVSETGNVYVCGKGKVWKKREEAMQEGGGTGEVTREEFDQLSEEIAVISSATVSDNGKFLRVVDGKPQWKSVPNAEEASF